MLIDSATDSPDGQDQDQGQDRLAGSSLARGLGLLGAFHSANDWLGNAELAARTGLPKPTVSRLCATLVELGFLRRNNQGRFFPGMHLLALAYPVLTGLQVRALARPLMMEVAAQIKGPVSIATIDGLFAVSVETARSSLPHPIDADIGMTAPLLQVAVGRAILYQLEDQQRQDILARSRTELPAITDRFEGKLASALESCRQNGYCLSLGDFNPSVHTVSVPLFTLPDGLPLALFCGVAAFRLGPGELERDVAPRALGLADGIRSMLRSRESNT